MITINLKNKRVYTQATKLFKLIGFKELSSTKYVRCSEYKFYSQLLIGIRSYFPHAPEQEIVIYYD